MTTEHTEARQLSVTDVAERAGLKPTTVSNYASRGFMPRPDGHIGRTPWWWEHTITDWLKSRPGQGWRKGLKGDHRGQA